MEIRRSYSKPTYLPDNRKLIHLMRSGLVATGIMLAIAYLLRALGFSAPDFAALYGAILNGQLMPEPLSTLWWAGLVWHIFNGTLVFAVLYDYLADRTVLPAEKGKKRAVYGALVWLFFEILVEPAAGNGFFSRLVPSPFAYAILSLLCWEIYVSVLDGMLRVRVKGQLETPRRAA